MRSQEVRESLLMLDDPGKTLLRGKSMWLSLSADPPQRNALGKKCARSESSMNTIALTDEIAPPDNIRESGWLYRHPVPSRPHL